MHKTNKSRVEIIINQKSIRLQILKILLPQYYIVIFAQGDLRYLTLTKYTSLTKY